LQGTLDSAHGFLFQHHAEFAADIDAFLTTASYETTCPAIRTGWGFTQGLQLPVPAGSPFGSLRVIESDGT